MAAVAALDIVQGQNRLSRKGQANAMSVCASSLLCESMNGSPTGGTIGG